MPRALSLEGELAADALQVALQQVIQRHDILRTRFEEIDGLPMQVLEPQAYLQLQREDLSALGTEERDTQLQQRLLAEAAKPFDLSGAPLIRASLIRLAQDRHVLLLNMHHIVSDAWSNPILMQDLASAYRSALQGDSQALPRPAIQYADYARWQRQDYPATPQHAKAARYWRCQRA